MRTITKLGGAERAPDSVVDTYVRSVLARMLSRVTAQRVTILAFCALSLSPAKEQGVATPPTPPPGSAPGVTTIHWWCVHVVHVGTKRQ